MNFKIIFALLMLNLIQNGLCSEDMTFIEEIQEINFKKGNLTQDQTDQLHCLNPDNLDGLSRKQADDFCDKFGPTFVKCVNPDKKQTFDAFKCTGTFPNPNYSFKSYQIDCLEASHRPEYYYKRTCKLNYRLQKGRSRDDGKDGDKKNNKSWFKNNLGYILGGIATVCVAILIGAAVIMQCRKKDNEGSDL